MSTTTQINLLFEYCESIGAILSDSSSAKVKLLMEEINLNQAYTLVREKMNRRLNNILRLFKE